MSTDVTFFEETPFFSSSMQDLQQVLPIPSFSPIVSPTYETPNQEGNQNHSPTESSSTQNHSPTKSPSPPVTSPHPVHNHLPNHKTDETDFAYLHSEPSKSLSI